MAHALAVASTDVYKSAHVNLGGVYVIMARGWKTDVRPRRFQLCDTSPFEHRRRRELRADRIPYTDVPTFIPLRLIKLFFFGRD